LAPNGANFAGQIAGGIFERIGARSRRGAKKKETQKRNKKKVAARTRVGTVFAWQTVDTMMMISRLHMKDCLPP